MELLICISIFYYFFLFFLIILYVLCSTALLNIRVVLI